MNVELRWPLHAVFLLVASKHHAAVRAARDVLETFPHPFRQAHLVISPGCISFSERILVRRNDFTILLHRFADQTDFVEVNFLVGDRNRLAQQLLHKLAEVDTFEFDVITVRKHGLMESVNCMQPQLQSGANHTCCRSL